MPTASPGPHPTEGELSILRVLWAHKDPMTVRDVHAVLSRDKETAYTTVLKMLTIMADKGLVDRDASERTHTYRAVHDEPVVQATMLKDLVRRAFAGSATALMQRALDDDATSPEELDAIAELIAAAKKKRAKG